MIPVVVKRGTDEVNDRVAIEADSSRRRLDRGGYKQDADQHGCKQVHRDARQPAPRATSLKHKRPFQGCVLPNYRPALRGDRIVSGARSESKCRCLHLLACVLGRFKPFLCGAVLSPERKFSFPSSAWERTPRSSASPSLQAQTRSRRDFGQQSRASPPFRPK